MLSEYGRDGDPWYAVLKSLLKWLPAITWKINDVLNEFVALWLKILENRPLVACLIYYWPYLTMYLNKDMNSVKSCPLWSRSKKKYGSKIQGLPGLEDASGFNHQLSNIKLRKSLNHKAFNSQPQGKDQIKNVTVTSFVKTTEILSLSTTI